MKLSKNINYFTIKKSFTCFVPSIVEVDCSIPGYLVAGYPGFFYLRGGSLQLDKYTILDTPGSRDGHGKFPLTHFSEHSHTIPGPYQVKG